MGKKINKTMWNGLMRQRFFFILKDMFGGKTRQLIPQKHHTHGEASWYGTTLFQLGLGLYSIRHTTYIQLSYTAENG